MNILTIILLSVLASCSSIERPSISKNIKKEQWNSSVGIKNPESTYYDSKTGYIFVSNVAGSPLKTDRSGFISVLNRNGKVINHNWVKSLHAPKGLKSHNGILWVSDVNRVLGIEIKSGSIKHRISIPNAEFLNDIAISEDGAVYVSDMFANSIYKIEGTKLSLFLKSEKLASPNGLYIDNDKIIVASWGKGINRSTFATKMPGKILEVDIKTKRIKSISKHLGNLDGLEIDKFGNYIVSDWIAGKIYSFNKKDESVTLIYKANQGVADIGIHKESNTIFIPKMMDNSVSSIKL